MLNISNNDIITLTRGDSGSLSLTINLGTVAAPVIYDLVSGDKVYLGICEPRVAFEHAILKKVYTSTDYDLQEHALVIAFSPEDTEFLLPGVYYYSIKLYRPASQTSSEMVDTIIGRRKFIIID